MDVNVKNKKSKSSSKKKTTFKCVICKKKNIPGPGNNPSPVKEEGICCDTCNYDYVIPQRLVYEEDHSWDWDYDFDFET